MSSRLVFLTGATGFIGGRLAAALHARGDRLRCLVRDPRRADALRALGAELVQGDVTDRAVMTRGLEGADVAYHVAAIYDLGVVDRDALERTNIGGTRTFLDAVRAVGTPRALYVSSNTALGPVGDGEGDEHSHYDGPYPTVYHRTKKLAHDAALAAQRDGLPLIILCPTSVYGPDDYGPMGRFLCDLVLGRVPGLVSDPAWFPFVYVDDVAAGLVAADERARPGTTYVLGGEYATITAFGERAAAVAGVRAPRLRFPPRLALVTGAALDVVSRVLGKRFSMSRESVAAVTSSRWLHSHASTTRDLEYSPRGLDEGLVPTMAWARSFAGQLR